MIKLLLLVLVILLSACKKSEKDDSRLPEDVDLKQKYTSLVNRFVSLSDEGWVVARKKDDPASLDKIGDSLIWTGISLAGLPCDEARVVLDVLLEEAIARDGKLPRHRSFEKNADSIDGMVGVNYGLIRLSRKCKSLKPKASELYSLTRDFYRSMLTESLYYVIDRGDAFFGINNLASKATEVLFDAAISGWARGIVSGKLACYKLHLATLMAAFVEESGAAVKDAEFCSITKNTKLPMTDAYCGRRREAKAFLEGFKINEWENKNQRCEDWESENNSGLVHAGIDFLEAYDYTF